MFMRLGCGFGLLLLSGLQWSSAESDDQDPDDHAPQEPKIDPYKALGLKPGSSEVDVQVAYKKFSTEQRVGGIPGGELAQIQKAYEAVSSAEMRQDALGFVNYWAHVRRLTSDDGLQQFAEFQAGHPAELRIIFVIDGKEDPNFHIFSAAMLLHGRARVAQISKSNTMEANGAPARFIASFKLRQYPAVIVFDPISRASRVKYEFEGVGAEAERLVVGDLGPADRIARVQELNTDTFASRCGGATPCKWAVMVVTRNILEESSNDFANAVRPFIEACRLIHGIKDTACFWLRLGRAPQWNNALTQLGMPAGQRLTFVAARVQPFGVGMAPAEMIGASSEDLAHWFRNTMAKEAVSQTRKLDLPRPIALDDEPTEPWTNRMKRKFKREGIAMLDNSELLFQKAEAYVRGLDTESKVMLAGAVLLAMVSLHMFCSKCCCVRRAPAISEEAAMQNLDPVIMIPLRRQPGEKLGMGIEPNKNRGLTVTSVMEGGGIFNSNMNEPRSERRIRDKDWLKSAYRCVDGKTVCSSTSQSITEALQSGTDVVLAVVMSRSDQEVCRLESSVVLTGLVLQDVADLAMPQGSHGPGDTMAVEVASISPTLAAWNAERQGDGSCCMQCIEVGDRVVSINGSADVRLRLGEKNPTLVVVRWLPAGTVSPRRIYVNIEKTGPEDKLGMQIRPRPGLTKQIEVLEVVENLAVWRWNASGAGDKVHRGDRLVEVNGQTEVEKIGPELQSARLALVFERWSVDSNARLTGSGGIPADSVPPPPPPVLIPKYGPGGKVTAPAPQQVSWAPQDPSSYPAPQMAQQMAPQMAPQAAPGALHAAPPIKQLAAPQVTSPQAGPMLAAPAPQAYVAPQASPLAASPQVSRPQASPQAASAPSSSAAATGVSATFVGVAVLVVLALVCVAGPGLLAPAANARGGSSAPPSAVAAALINVLGSGSAQPLRMPSAAKPFVKRIHPALLGDLAGLLLAVGGFLFVHFVRYEVVMLKKSHERRLIPQLMTALVSSITLGHGFFLLLAWAGVYV